MPRATDTMTDATPAVLRPSSPGPGIERSSLLHNTGAGCLFRLDYRYLFGRGLERKATSAFMVRAGGALRTARYPGLLPPHREVPGYSRKSHLEFLTLKKRGAGPPSSGALASIRAADYPRGGAGADAAVGVICHRGVSPLLSTERSP